jgi:ABC-type Fe3+ transport system permease subunit
MAPRWAGDHRADAAFHCPVRPDDPGVLQIRRRHRPLPAITAVFLYSLLPIMRNTYLALENIEAGVKEAGIGIGMTFWQRLRMVDLPLAVPVILGGVRTAVVMNIGVMAIAAVIGAGGLGVLILHAISQSNMQTRGRRRDDQRAGHHRRHPCNDCRKS